MVQAKEIVLTLANFAMLLELVTVYTVLRLISIIMKNNVIIVVPFKNIRVYYSFTTPLLNI